MDANVVYMWNFKPDENAEIPLECILKNEQYIQKYQIITPSNVEPCLSSFENLSFLWHKIPNEYWIIKADLGRLLYIYINGGFYLDVDCLLTKNPLISGTNSTNDDLTLFTESIVNVNCLGPRECKNPANSVRIANFAFGTNCLKHPFIELCIKECIFRLENLFGLNLKKWEQTDILWVCGPDVITTVYHEHKKLFSSITLLDTTFTNHLSYGSWRTF
jgi:hypothetical protein